MDITLHYTEQGQGEPLVLLHGNGGDGSYFTEQLSGLSRHFRVIALDTRGYGGSPRGEKPFSLVQFAEDLRDWMDEQGFEKINLLGFSDGGNIALLFALKYPARVKKLIVNGANLYPRGVKLSEQIPIVRDYYLLKLSGAAKRDEEKARQLARLGLMVTQPHISPESLQKLTMPVLVIAGNRDMIRGRHTRLIAKSLPDSFLCIMEGDHFIARKNSEVYNQKVEAFLLHNRKHRP